MKHWLPGNLIGKIWPSDKIRNFSADGRAMGREAAKVFRRALGLPDKEERP